MIPSVGDTEVGDRRQEIVFIGAGLDREGLEEKLRAALLSDEELVLDPAMWERMDVRGTSRNWKGTLTTDRSIR